MDLARLRRETEADHNRTEATVPLMADDLPIASYLRTLGRMYGFVRGWELWADRHAPEDLRSVLAERQRSPLIAKDLQHFGRPLPPQVATLSLDAPGKPMDRPGFLGAMYVMEGSTLGGQYLAAHAEKLFGLQHGQGNAYFVGYGDRTGSMWNAFKGMLTELPEQDADAVIASAKRMFAEFEQWMTAPSGGTGEPRTRSGQQADG